MRELESGETLTRLCICAALAAAAVLAAEKLCPGKGWALWEQYGSWLMENKLQAIALTAAVLYALSLVLWPEERLPREEPESMEGFSPCQ